MYIQKKLIGTYLAIELDEEKVHSNTTDRLILAKQNTTWSVK